MRREMILITSIAAVCLAGSLMQAQPVRNDSATQKTVGTNGALPGQSPLGFPLNGSSDISVNADLVWIEATDAKFYDLYFGTDPTPDSSEYQGAVFATSFTLGVLDWSTTYYWRVNPRNFAGTTTGVVWSFTTEVQPVPDLNLTSVSYDTVPPYVIGGNISVRVDVSNDGDAPASGIHVDYYASTNSTITTFDTLIGTYDRGALPDGMVFATIQTLDIPESLLAGNYYFGAIVSEPDGLETNLSNNARSGASPVTLIDAVHDLAAMECSYDAGGAYNLDGTIDVTTRVRNDGNVPTTIMQADYYVSTNSTITTFDTFIGTRGVGVVAPGDTWTLTDEPIHLPVEIGTGTYYIGIIVSEMGVADATPSDNWLSGASPIVVGPELVPDLAALSCGYEIGSSYLAGDAVSVLTSVENIGFASAMSVDLDFYASTNSTISVGDIFIETTSQGAIGVGVLHNVSETIFLPADIAPGDYYIGYIASESQGLDPNVNNNWVSGDAPLTVVGDCAADLNGDGALNFFDVSVFLSAFASGDLAADFTGDGLLNFFDVSAFLGAFAAGCP